MLRKIKKWWRLRRRNNIYEDRLIPPQEYFTRDQLENAYKLGYNDGKRDGLAIARHQATQSLKEILWQQNKQAKK